MIRSVLLLVALLSLLTFPARAGDAAAVEDARRKLFEVLLSEEQVDERCAAVAALAALDTPDAAKALLEAIDRLGVRTAQAETRAAKTRADYEPYKGAAQASDRDWAIKQRLIEQMDKDDRVLRGDALVAQAFVAGIAAMKDGDSLRLVDRAAAKDDLGHARLVHYGGLLRNPATNAADLGKRAIADQDVNVRLAALLAFADRKDKAFADHAMKALSDPNWAFRQAGVRALSAIGDVRYVGMMIATMAAEDGQLLEEYAEALAKLTGASLGPNPESWKRWYDDNKEELAAKGGKPAQVKPPKDPLKPPVDYYGIPTRSLRLMFVIDCSGSMNEPMAPASGTSDSFATGKKIDVAKKLLKATIAKLHPSTLFNVIVFNTDARALEEKLVMANDFNKHTMNEKVDELVGRGGTWTYGALKLALGVGDAAATPSRPPVDTIFLLSDGAPTEATFEEAVEAKPMDSQKILDAVQQWNPFRSVRIHTIAIDTRIDKTGANFVRFMRDLAAQNGGTYTAVGEK